MLQITNLSIRCGAQSIVSNLNLSIAPGEIVTLTGASGSGKSTILNWMVGDLDSAFSATGKLQLNGQRLDALPIASRRIGILFQDDSLFLHLSVGRNLAFALPAKIRGTVARRELVEQTLHQIGLAGMHDRDPATLSGGQRARVSLMRALLAEPLALLLDEPFSKLDSTLREQFRVFVFDQIARLKIPTLLVTHDLNDAPAGGRNVALTHTKS